MTSLPPHAALPQSAGAGRRRAEVGPRSGDTPVFERVVTGEKRDLPLALRRLSLGAQRLERPSRGRDPSRAQRLRRGLVGDHIGAFEPGHLAMVGGGLPHDWVTPIRPGEVIRGRDIVVQFHPDRLRSAAALLPEVAEIDGLLAEAAAGSPSTARRAAEARRSWKPWGRSAVSSGSLCSCACSRRWRRGASAESCRPTSFVAQHRPSHARLRPRPFAFVVENFRRDIRLARPRRGTSA